MCVSSCGKPPLASVGVSLYPIRGLAGWGQTPVVPGESESMAAHPSRADPRRLRPPLPARSLGALVSSGRRLSSLCRPPRRTCSLVVCLPARLSHSYPDRLRDALCHPRAVCPPLSLAPPPSGDLHRPPLPLFPHPSPTQPVCPCSLGLCHVWRSPLPACSLPHPLYRDRFRKAAHTLTRPSPPSPLCRWLGRPHHGRSLCVSLRSPRYPIPGKRTALRRAPKCIGGRSFE